MTIKSDVQQTSPAAGSGRRKVVWTGGRRAAFAVIGVGSSLIATTGFVGSYTAVRNLAVDKGFGCSRPSSRSGLTSALLCCWRSISP